MTEAGQRIADDRYELITPLAEGGMGVVWRARDLRLGRTVAVKLLTRSALGNDTARIRLIREARAAATLEHDDIIRVYDVGELPDGGAFLVMELLRGKSLREELVHEGPLAPARCIRIIVSVARALAFAHHSGVVHRDVKPDNIMLRDGGSGSGSTSAGQDRVVVVDFGVAKPVATEIVADAETLAGITQSTLTGGHIVGTPAYLSPEQARGASDVDATTDQFALAVTAFEVMTGRRPWVGTSVIEVVASILRDTPTSLCSLVPDVPVAIERVIFKALAKKPADRFTDMNAFADALESEAAAAALRVSAAPPPPRTPALGSVSAVPVPGTVSTHGGQSTTPAPSDAENAKRQRRTTITLGLALLVAFSLGYYVLRVRGSASSSSLSTTSPNASSIASVACPSFDVTGTGADGAQYLGAAAAALACERVQLARGGIDTRTLVPAELVSAPREIVPDFPRYLFDTPQARANAIAAAKRSAASWLDGKIEKQVTAFIVTITLRSPDGSELARGEGRGVEIFEAVRDALAPVLAKSAPPTREELAHLHEWLDVDSADAAFALLDVRTAILIEDPVSLRAACGAIETRADLLPRVRYLARSMCRRKLRTGPLAEAPPPIDDTTMGALITTSLAQGTAGGPAEMRARAGRLEQARDRTVVPEGRAHLSAAAAEIYNLIGDERARDLSRNAILSSPKAVDWRASPWHRIAFIQSADASLASAISTWQPWEPITQSIMSGRPPASGSGATAFDAGEAAFEGRGYLLSRRGPYASAYGTNLLERGDIEAARNVAELAQDDILRVELMAAEARYAAVLAKVPVLLAALPANDENAATAFRLTYQGVRASRVLERSPDFVGPVVERYILSEPHHIIDGVAPVLSMVNACLFAPRPIGQRCIERFEQLRRDNKLPTIFSTMETVLAGANRFVVDDYAGAVRSWRMLLRSSGWIHGPLREPLAIAFDRAGESELADEVDSAIVALVDLPRTADLAWARAAKRAQKRGDTAEARRLARAVVDKWRFADDRVPATQEMKDLLGKLGP